MVPSSVMVAVRLNFLACLVRCISSYLDGEKIDPCLLAQPIYQSCTRASAKQLPSVDLPQARMLMSSTNPKPLDRSPMPLQIRTSSSLKKRYRIGEIGDPWGILFWTRSSPDSSEGRKRLQAVRYDKETTKNKTAVLTGKGVTIK